MLTIPTLLEARADEQPDAVPYTFFDYDTDPGGVCQSVTWADLQQRVRSLAARLSVCAAPGERAAVLAPQGIDYIVAFFGALHAGLLAVPLPVPSLGGLDERVVGALRDSTPSVVLTTSAAAADVVRHAGSWADVAAPEIVEVDALDTGAAAPAPAAVSAEATAYLQYTSGSTRNPAGVMLTHRNVIGNVNQIMADYGEHIGGGAPEDLTMVSWLPFYHDMGLVMGVLAPLVIGRSAVLMSPMAFLQKPARWIRHLASHPSGSSAAPNFAFEMCVRRVADADMEGLDLSRVSSIVSGGERIHLATVHRFYERFERFGLPRSAFRCSYGLAEATVYVTTSPGGRAPTEVSFDVERLSAGRAEVADGGGSELVGCGAARSCDVRIVDPETSSELPPGEVGEIWVRGEQVASGYWRNPEMSARVFGGQLANPSDGAPRGPWLRTGDLGVLHGGELFVVGRIKDLLIIDGRNHYPDDIEATVQETTAGRVAAVSIQGDASERLVVVAETKDLPGSPGEALDVRRRVAASVRKAHGVRVSDLVLVGLGSLPITTSGKVRRSTCAERYRRGEFAT